MSWFRDPLAQRSSATRSIPSGVLDGDGLQNGELLERAAGAGYDALIMVDKGFEYEQNLSQLPVTVVLLRAPSNRLEDLAPHVSELLERLKEAEPSSFIKLGA